MPDKRGKTKISKDSQEAVGTNMGDTLASETRPDGSVVVRKIRSFSVPWHEAISNMFADEWISPEDEKAFRDL